MSDEKHISKKKTRELNRGLIHIGRKTGQNLRTRNINKAGPKKRKKR